MPLTAGKVGLRPTLPAGVLAATGRERDIPPTPLSQTRSFPLAASRVTPLEGATGRRERIGSESKPRTGHFSGQYSSENLRSSYWPLKWPVLVCLFRTYTGRTKFMRSRIGTQCTQRMVRITVDGAAVNQPSALTLCARYKRTFSTASHPLFLPTCFFLKKPLDRVVYNRI